jgi:hypothetical protein
LAQEFLDKKEQEKQAYWDTPEGKKELEVKWAEAKARFDK